MIKHDQSPNACFRLMPESRVARPAPSAPEWHRHSASCFPGGIHSLRESVAWFLQASRRHRRTNGGWGTFARCSRCRLFKRTPCTYSSRPDTPSQLDQARDFLASDFKPPLLSRARPTRISELAALSLGLAVGGFRDRRLPDQALPC